MIGPLAVYLAPSPRGRAWMEALWRAAEAAGRRVVVDGHDLAIEDPRPVLHLIHDPARALETPAGGLTVLWDGIEATVAGVEAAWGEGAEPREVVREAARHAAAAADRAEAGADLRGMDAPLDHALLGLVRIEAARPIKARADAAPLAVFADMPPRPGRPVAWPLPLFQYPTGKIGEFDGGSPRIDMTGRGRIVLHGPYITLPRGRWRIEVRLMVDPEGSPTTLRFDWGVDQDVTTTLCDVDRPGVYSLALDRDWREPGPAQLRIWLARSQFVGRMEVLEAKVTLLGPPQPAPDDGALKSPGEIEG